MGGPSPYTAVSATDTMDSPPGSPSSMKARVLFDYDAKDSTELSLIIDEVIQLNFDFKNLQGSRQNIYESGIDIPPTMKRYL